MGIHIHLTRIQVRSSFSLRGKVLIPAESLTAMGRELFTPVPVLMILAELMICIRPEVQFKLRSRYLK